MNAKILIDELGKFSGQLKHFSAMLSKVATSEKEKFDKKLGNIANKIADQIYKQRKILGNSFKIKIQEQALAERETSPNVAKAPTTDELSKYVNWMEKLIKAATLLLDSANDNQKIELNALIEYLNKAKNEFKKVSNINEGIILDMTISLDEMNAVE